MHRDRLTSFSKHVKQHLCIRMSKSIYIYLSASSTFYPFVCLSSCLSVCLSVSLFVRPSVRLSVCHSAYLSLSLSVSLCVSACLSLFVCQSNSTTVCLPSYLAILRTCPAVLFADRPAGPRAFPKKSEIEKKVREKVHERE